MLKNGIFLSNIFETVKRTASHKLFPSIWLWARILAPAFRLCLRFSFKMLNSARIHNFSWLFTYLIRFWIFRGLLTFFFDFSFFFQRNQRSVLIFSSWCSKIVFNIFMEIWNGESILIVIFSPINNILVLKISIYFETNLICISMK